MEIYIKLIEQLKSNLITHCPKCGYLISANNTGCNQQYCSICNTYFCNLCDKILNPNLGIFMRGNDNRETIYYSEILGYYTDYFKELCEKCHFGTNKCQAFSSPTLSIRMRNNRTMRKFIHQYPNNQKFIEKCHHEFMKSHDLYIWSCC